jgi:hypothetical protein
MQRRPLPHRATWQELELLRTVRTCKVKQTRMLEAHAGPLTTRHFGVAHVSAESGGRSDPSEDFDLYPDRDP